MRLSKLERKVTVMMTGRCFVENKETWLVRLVCEGDKDAFWALVEPCHQAVFSVAATMLNSVADAEQVAQEVVVKAFSNIREFRGDAKFSTWLIQITINEARQRLRKDRKHLYEPLDEPQNGDADQYVPKDFADWREIPSEALQRKELRDALVRALASLPQKYREVLSLRDIEHLTSQETAQALGLTLANVKTRLLRARLQMRDALALELTGAGPASRSEY